MEMRETLQKLWDARNCQGIAALEKEARAAAETLEVKLPKVAGVLYSYLGLAYSSLGRHRRAVEMHAKHLAIAHEVGDRAEVGSANGNLGKAYNSLGN